MTSEQSLRQAERRRFRHFVLMSLGGHVLAAAMLGVAPSRPLAQSAPIISVDLLAALPRPASPAPAPAPSPSKPAAKPAAKPPPQVLAPPKPNKIVLPKQAPAATRKPRKVDRRPPKRAKPEELDYGDALAQLRKDLGESEPASEVVAQAEAAPSAASATGVRVTPEMLAWVVEVKRHVRAGWVTPSEFLDRDLKTGIAVVLAEDGRLIGRPRVIAPSGDPFWDDSAVRAIRRADPLPPPPSPGERQFSFGSRETR